MHNCMEKIVFPHIIMEKELKASERGCVYLVRDKETHTRYIYRVFNGSGEVYRRMHGIDCPHLPVIHEVKEENGTVHVLEEYVQGDTLAFLLEGKPLAAAQATQIIIQLCYALHILHGIGVIHRDIKPANIIMRGSDAVLIDFDASRLRKAANTTDTQVMGTTGYAAPEQYGFTQTDARTDIYALGILLNEMLTGQHPSRQLAEGDFRPVIQKCTFRLFPFLLLLLLVVSGAVFLYRVLTAPESSAGTQETDGDIVLEEPLHALPEIDVFVREKQEIAAQPWILSIDGYATPFKCDMDGDGEKESYLFGVDFIDSPHENVVYYDRNLALPNDYHIRNIHPCVWRVNTNGTMEVATVFAKYLADTQVTVWRVDDLTSPDPEIWTTDYIWSGCVNVTFRPKQDGTWLYEVCAYLGEHRLTAVATTTFYFD